MELDIMEHLTRWGPYRYNVALHLDGYGKEHKAVGSSCNYVQADKDGFITPGLLWTPGSAVFYCNGKEIWRWENPRVSNVPSHFIIEMTTGGWDNNAVDDNATAGRLPDRLRPRLAAQRPCLPRGRVSFRAQAREVTASGRDSRDREESLAAPPCLFHARRFGQACCRQANSAAGQRACPRPLRYRGAGFATAWHPPRQRGTQSLGTGCATSCRASRLRVTYRVCHCLAAAALRGGGQAVLVPSPYAIRYSPTPCAWPRSLGYRGAARHKSPW